MQIWAESGKSALPICIYSQILYQFLTFTQNLKRSLGHNRTSGDLGIPDFTSEFQFTVFALYCPASRSFCVSYFAFSF